MRKSLSVLALLLATTACGGPARDSSPPADPQPTMRYDSSPNAVAEDMAAPGLVRPEGGQATRAAGPNVGPTAAPGVAFNYRYAFRLAAPRVAQVQEQHAQLCERLTVARCRITGMRYRVVNDRDIEAMLAFKLDPAIARRFGREGVDAVVRAEGMLTESEITGTDAATGIRNAGRSIAQLNEELRRIEARLAGRLSADERSRLEYEAQALRQSIRAQESSRQEQAESLATTPMMFNYGSGQLVPGFDGDWTLAKAWSRALDNLASAGLAAMIIVITLAPWVLLGLLLWWAVVRVRRRFAKPAGENVA